jgi:hypothetical protein
MLLHAERAHEGDATRTAHRPPGSTIVVVIVTDEGDNSRRIEEGEADPSVYLDLFGEFENPVKFAVIGPTTMPTTTS